MGICGFEESRTQDLCRRETVEVRKEWFDQITKSISEIKEMSEKVLIQSKKTNEVYDRNQRMVGELISHLDTNSNT